MSMSFDFTEVDALAVDLGEVPDRVRRNVPKALTVTARNMKDDWRNLAKGASGRHAKAFPNAITYDVETLADGYVADIGPELQRNQGALGFLEEGVGSQNTAGQNAIPLVVKANENDFIRGMLLAVAEPLEG